MTLTKVFSAASALIAAASLTSFLAPFVLSPALSSSTQTLIAQAPWLLIGAALFAIIWLSVSRTAIDSFFRFATNRPILIEAPGRALRFALYGIPGLLRQPPRNVISNSEKSLPPACLVLLCAFVGFVGTLAADGLVQLISGRIILPPVVLTSFRLVLAAAIVLVAIAPLIETVVMVLILEALQRFGLSRVNAAIISAAAWAGWHAFVNHPAQAPSMFWLFLVLGTLYMFARSRMSPVKAAVLIAGAHAANNALALLFILVKQGVLSI